MAGLEAIEMNTAAEPVATVVVLHGLGADGNDFVPVVRALDLTAVGPVRFLLPHAPVIPVTINNGYRMRAWYDILGMELVRREDEAGLRRSRDDIEALLAREHERGMPAGRIVLAGFSQGCAMALLTGLRHGRRLAGIAGLSGYLPLAQHTAAERSDANALTPIFMAHGLQDEVVAIERGRASRDLLGQQGHQVEWHEYPMGHSVSLDEIADFNRWLLDVLARP
ncbi:carboxylesterase [Ramlibacter sp. RBP-2]|uniref:Carboxylesterase n=1 Tax=Ramlibacter lithotrophicus TaxID=2606681 RepID=A0A7X6DHM3_9BURK|nr:dienelactone hydrolase family protein [Ramlibacter lithotrophicus]NKE67355.1 carboxylesterase [Ramlibacter lithotrophicus]